VKFLVIWQIDIALLSKQVLQMVMTMPDYAGPLERSGKVVARYHIPGTHGGAWIYDVDSNEELDHLLARSPVFNFSRYTIHPLAEMTPARGRTDEAPS
jgi:muconolactone delta-isomerase